MCTEGIWLAQLLTQMLTFAQTYFTTTTSLCQTALRAWAAIYFAWRLIDLALARGIDPKEVTEQILAFIFIDCLYLAPSLVWDFVDIIMSSGMYMAGKIGQAAAQGPQGADPASLVCYAIGGIDDALGAALRHSLQNLSIWELGHAVLIILIWIVYTALFLKIIKYVSIPLVRIFGVTVLLPAIMFLAAIPAMRLAAMNGIKVLLSAAKEMILVTAMVGLLAQMILQAAKVVPVNKSTISSASTAWLGSPGYWFVLFMMVVFFFVIDELMQVPATLLQIIVAHTKFNLPAPRAGK